ncbi:Ca2+-transporting ATPase [Humitalea rosea]|uniref:Ca2+-transporting ATPase n=1 Tax=Humitalea rosea TaxID=990373 RepID=A0A2W7IJG3_9PROT|nr:cation-transporting P-type ATPase [Humitalea rosea]PZW46838.1 Ca2+-transporting ATPase [Humitalea rosea]
MDLLGIQSPQHAPAIETRHAAVPGRLRLRLPALRGATAAALALEHRLLASAGILAASVSALTGSILLHHAPAVSAEAATRLVADLHGAPAAEPAAPAPSQPTPWHALPAAALVRDLGATPETGLTDAEAAARLLRFGPNRMARPQPRGLAALFAEEFTSLPVVLLGASAVVSLATGGIADAVVILGVVLANAVIATATERQAERTILALDEEAPGAVPLLRDGRRLSLPPEALVPGDILLAEAGTLVPADARLLTATELTVNESALTGESLPVVKSAGDCLAADAPLAERSTMLFRGTAVTGGAGRAVVVATGQGTEIGRIQALLGTLRPPETPIQKELDGLGRQLVWINGAICLGVLGLGLARGRALLPTLRSAISLAVAAVPEGLPAVATTTLASGIQQMRREGVLVRRLGAIETLGSVQVVCLDKTGTLTRNLMAVVALRPPAGECGWEAARLVPAAGVDAACAAAEVWRLLELASLCSDVELGPAGLAGSPTEAALVRAAQEHGIDVAALRAGHPRLSATPRAEGRKRMATVHGAPGGGRLLAMKGDPVEVLALCGHRLAGAGIVPLTAPDRAAIRAANDAMAGRALRVLGVACGDGPEEAGLVWCGLAGIADPLRQDAKAAIATLHAAGVRTAMITGDQAATAIAIARALDLANGPEITVLEAGQFDTTRPEVLAALAPRADAFARVSPAQKLQVVRALQAGGGVVAMTGDGVNDGPALRAADVGIAMGAGGTEVARQAADIVLAGDELDGILRALGLGRAITGNIRKVLRYLVSTNLSESLVMLGAAGLGLPEPLSPMQLLWLNLVSDVAPALALGLDPAEGDELSRAPRPPGAPLLGREDMWRIGREGTVMAVVTLAAQLVAGRGTAPVTFHAITLAQLLHALACRSDHRGLVATLRQGKPNPLLFAAAGGGIVLQVLAQAVPGLRRLLGLGALTPGGMLAVAVAGFGTLALNEAITAAARKGGSTDAG